MKICRTRFWLSVLAIFGISNSAFAISTTVVISQIYSGQDIGKPGGPKARNDFIELFNRGTTAADLTGWSLMIADTPTGNTWRAVPLSGSMAPGQYFLIRGAVRKGTAALPQPDATTDIELPAAAGRIAIVVSVSIFNNSTADCPAGSAVDFVAFGASPNCTVQSSAMDSQQAMVRGDGGCLETDGVDFSPLPPFPRNSSSPRNVCSSTPATRTYTIPATGGVSLQSSGAASSLAVGYVRIQPSSGNNTPTGLAIFSLKQGQTLLSEATVPAVPLILSGQTFAEVSGAINTGVAIANPGGDDAIVQFSFVDSGRGVPTQFGSVTVPARSQLARFLNELPFGMATPLQGTLILQSSVPVGIVALRGYSNERGEFLVTTLPVVDTSSPVSTDPAYLAHFAIGGGWSTEIVLMGRTDDTATGSVEFRDSAGKPVNVKSGQTATSFSYSLTQKSSTKFLIASATGDLVIGSVRVVPTGGTVTPVAVAVFSYTRNNVRVSEAGLVGIRGSRFRTYIEYSGIAGMTGSIQPGLAIANTGTDTATVSLDLTRLDGTSTGLTATVTVPGSGQVAKFVNELFPTLAAPFQGILRVSTTSSITLIGLRGRYNERNDFLITTVPASDESAATTSAEFSFPHLADSGGYTTQFVLFGSSGQASSGNLRLFTAGGQPLPLDLR